MSIKLEPLERDMLLEAASIAGGKIIKPIGNIIGQTASVAPPQLLLTDMERIADAMGKPDESKTVVFVRISGEARGAIVLLINPADMGQLLPNVADELRVSALEEITNIVAGASLGGLTRLLNILFVQSVPVSTTDMLRAVVNEVVVEVGGTASDVLCMIIELKVGQAKIPASMYLLFDSDSTAAIIRAGKRLVERQYGGS